jgi:hypothetical protein
VQWSAYAGASWLRLSRTSGTLVPGQSFTIRVSVDHAGEPRGHWSARVSVDPSGAVVLVQGNGRDPRTRATYSPQPSSGDPGAASHPAPPPGDSGAPSDSGTPSDTGTPTDSGAPSPSGDSGGGSGTATSPDAAPPSGDTGTASDREGATPGPESEPTGG